MPNKENEYDIVSSFGECLFDSSTSTGRDYESLSEDDIFEALSSLRGSVEDDSLFEWIFKSYDRMTPGLTFRQSLHVPLNVLLDDITGLPSIEIDVGGAEPDEFDIDVEDNDG